MMPFHLREEGNKMKWLIVCLLAFSMVTPAMAGENLYVAVVGNDIDANTFYISPKLEQFLYDQESWDYPPGVCYGSFPPVGQYTRVGRAGCEQFGAQFPINQPEVCDTQGNNVCYPPDRGEPNAKIGSNSTGFFEWYVRLPEDPVGEINLCIQCGVLKPNAFTAYKYRSVNLCAAETGEKIGPGLCSPQLLWAGDNPLNISKLPTITAIAYPGPYSSFSPFNLTAFKNPSNYNISFDAYGAMGNNTASQVLDGTTQTRILLKSCMEKCIVVKLPVYGQINALGQPEGDLVQGDLIYVKMKVSNPGVDIYCNSQSLKVMGVGEPPN
jgi:hypothetical protein